MIEDQSKKMRRRNQSRDEEAMMGEGGEAAQTS